MLVVGEKVALLSCGTGRLRASNLVSGGACDVPQHEARRPGDVYRSGAAKLRGVVACACLPLDMTNAFYSKRSA